MARGAVINGRAKPKEKPSPAKLAAIRQNGMKPKATIYDAEQRERTREMKRILMGALCEEGVRFIAEIIKAGPFTKVTRYDNNGEPQVIEMFEERSRLWQYAMNYAADRGGFPRVQAVDVDVDAIPAIKVEFTEFERPSDV